MVSQNQISFYERVEILTINLSEMQGSQDSPNEAKPWAKLTSLTIQLENVNLLEESYTIGRNSVNKVVVPDIRLSKVHCKIFRDSEGIIWIEDMSSNGTFIEDEKIGKGNKRKLVSGDKIYLLHKSKVKTDDILGYVFELELFIDAS